MSSEDRNENLLNQMTTSLSLNTGLAAAGAAVLGGALYYYLNSGTGKNINLIDYKNQTREIAVSVEAAFYLKLYFCNCTNLRCCFNEIKGSTQGERISTMNKTDKLFSYYYEDATTLYGLFLKGRQLSSMLLENCRKIVTIIWYSLLKYNWCFILLFELC